MFPTLPPAPPRPDAEVENEASRESTANSSGPGAPVPLGDHEAGVLEAIMHLSAMLPEGWHAEVGGGNVTLSLVYQVERA